MNSSSPGDRDLTEPPRQLSGCTINNIERIFLEHCNAGRFAEAVNTARLWVSDHPGNGHGWQALGMALKQQGANEAALEAMEKARELLPNDAAVHHNLGFILKDLGRVSEAEAEYHLAIQLKWDFVETHNSLGGLLFELGRLREAETSYRLALQIKPDLTEVYGNLGATLYAQGRLDEAEVCYRQVLRIIPNHPQTLVNLASLLSKLGNYDESIAILKFLTAKHPEWSVVWSNLADVMADAGLHGELRKIANEAVLQHPKLLGPRLAVSGLLLMEHEANQALKILLEEQSLYAPGSKDRSRFRALLFIAVAGWLLGRRDLVDGPIRMFFQQCRPANRAEYNLALFARYLATLMKSCDSFCIPGLKDRVLLVVGDSHALGVCGQRIATDSWHGTVHSRLIMGCKAFHLASTGDNKYKYSLRKALIDVPPTAPVLLCLGEIDCRLDEGILLAYKNGKISNIDESIGGLVNGYISFVESIARPLQLTLGYQGIPAPHLEWGGIGETDKEQLVFVIKRFNHHLQRRCEVEGRVFVDVYSLTADTTNGLSNGRWHIDSHHLFPSYLNEIGVAAMFQPPMQDEVSR
jgi:tetratricopeptide (TPR) repeat protein